jgi:hypothetical protein
MTLDQPLDAFDEYLYLPDRGIVEMALAVVVSNRMTGDPFWLLLVGPSSSGKTEVLDALLRLSDIHPVSNFSEAGLLSGSSVKEGDTEATGGLLKELGDSGILCFKDFTTVLSQHGSTRDANLACLREVYDGAYTRRIGTKGGRFLPWTGKAGLIGAVTDAIDTVDMALLGPRFLYYRLPAMDDQDVITMTLAATENAGRQRVRRTALAEAVAEFFSHLVIPDGPPALVEADKHRIVVLADFAVRCRSAVVREGYQRQLQLVPAPERPPRFAAALTQLLGALRVLGVSENESWRLLAAVAFDAMHSLRRRVLDVLIDADLPMATAAVAGRASLPDATAVQHLENMTALGVVEHVGRGPDRWTPSAWCRGRVAAVSAIASGTWWPYDDELSPEDVEVLRRTEQQLLQRWDG